VSGDAGADPFRELIVFPTISQGTYQIKNQSLDRVRILVTSVDGRNMSISKKETGTNEATLELLDAASGIYFLRFVDHNGFTSTRKVVVSR
jgi:hypothetical protein